jgi:hypothetical protein
MTMTEIDWDAEEAAAASIGHDLYCYQWAAEMLEVEDPTEQLRAQIAAGTYICHCENSEYWNQPNKAWNVAPE